MIIASDFGIMFESILAEKNHQFKIPNMNRIIISGLVTILLIAIGGCEKNEFSNKGFVPIIEHSIYDSLKPNLNYDYYEIRDHLCYNPSQYKIIGSKGINTFSGTIIPNYEGIRYTTADLCLFINILTIKDNDYKFWVTYSEIKDFLGTIDTKSEALFIAKLNGYYFKYDDKTFGVKEENGKFQIVACKLVSACAPVQTDKFLIEINNLGKITILKQETVSKYENGCIK